MGAGVITQRAFASHTAVVVKAMNGASRNAQRLPWPDFDWSSADGPGQDSIDTVMVS
jgi:hypothetical protein